MRIYTAELLRSVCLYTHNAHFAHRTYSTLTEYITWAPRAHFFGFDMRARTRVRCTVNTHYTVIISHTHVLRSHKLHVAIGKSPFCWTHCL